MNAGGVEQISAPYELYTWRKNQFDADFMGGNALISGMAAAVEDAGLRVDSADGEIAGVSSSERSLVGSQATAALPAEAIDLLPSSTPTGFS